MWKFDTSMKWLEGETCEITAAGGQPPVQITPPADLGGKAGYWTPEDLLVSAIESCMLLTTLSVLAKQKVALKSYSSTAQGVMEKTPNGLRFTGLDIAITLSTENPADGEKAVRAVGIAEKYCPVSNAVNFPVRVKAALA